VFLFPFSWLLLEHGKKEKNHEKSKHEFVTFVTKKYRKPSKQEAIGERENKKI